MASNWEQQMEEARRTTIHSRNANSLPVNVKDEILWTASGGNIRVQDMDDMHLKRARPFAVKRNRAYGKLFDEYITQRRRGKLTQGDPLSVDSSNIFDIEEELIIV